MKNNVVELAGGTFVVTAISYAAGIGYYSGLFSALNAKSDLFSVSLERILFEGGRQLAYAAFYPALWISLAVLVVAAVMTFINWLGFHRVSNFRAWLSSLLLFRVFIKFGALFSFVFTVSLTSYTFTQAVAAGQNQVLGMQCVRAKVVTEKGNVSGCIVFKTDAEIWMAVSEAGRSVLVNIPADKYLSMRIF